MLQTIVVERVNTKPLNSKYNSGGVLAGGEWINVTSKLPIETFEVGQTYDVNISEKAVGDKVYKTIQSLEQSSNVSAKPSLPKSKVEKTKAPGGEAPIKPASVGTATAQVHTVDAEKMTKADWANKDRRIENQAILKAVLGSPVLATLAMSKTTSDEMNEFLNEEIKFLRGVLDTL